MSKLTDFDFDLPSELIAQKPVKNRGESKLLVVDREKKAFQIYPFHELVNLLTPDYELIFNNTKVFPARLFGRKETGAKIEILLSKKVSDHCWQVLAKPGKKLTLGTEITFSNCLKAKVIDDDQSTKILHFDCEGDFMQELERIGHIPLPPYIKREEKDEQDKEDYQTVYAKHVGSVAAPTAGLHFSNEIMQKLSEKGIEKHELTLHVGLGTFSPIVEEDLSRHQMHEESFWIPPALQKHLNESKDKKRIVVGTTTLRALESSADETGQIVHSEGSTRLFIQPGYRFKVVKQLLTNFHLPKSTLFILICSLMGTQLAKEAYQYAIDHKLRFFSYGDAMLIL